MNKIISDIRESRKSHYCHVVEVYSVEHLMTVIQVLINEFRTRYSREQIIDFFDTITVWSLSDANENEIHDFDILHHAIELLDK